MDHKTENAPYGTLRNVVFSVSVKPFDESGGSFKDLAAASLNGTVKSEHNTKIVYKHLITSSACSSSLPETFSSVCHSWLLYQERKEN